jgi:RNA polymerase sigma factor (sigma-70 family)
MTAFDEILQAAIGGDSEAFESLYRDLNRRVSAFARLRGAVDPDGLVNEVFFKAFTNLGSFEGGEAQFKAWIFRITRNQLIDESRKIARRPQENLIGPDDASLSELPGRASVEDVALGGFVTAQLRQILDDLTSEQREVVLLRVVSDLSVETVAEMIGKTPGAVKAIQRRALRKLFDQFSDKGVPQ